jgi:hypothetical protein
MLLCVLGALLLPHTQEHCFIASSEEFVLTLSSLYALTLYYPGSNRNGSLVPILASVVHDPALNMNLQMFLRSFCGFMAIALAALYLFPKRLVTLVVPIYFIFAFMQFSSSAINVLWLGAHPYSVSITTFFSGALLLRSIQGPQTLRIAARVLFAVLLFIISFWVNLSLYVFVFSFVFVYVILGFRPELRRLFRYYAVFFRGKESVSIPRAILSLYAFVIRLLLNRRELLLIFLATLAFVINDIGSQLYARYFPEMNRSFSSEAYNSIAFSLDSLIIAFRNLLRDAGKNALVIQFTCVFFGSIISMCVYYSKVASSYNWIVALRFRKYWSLFIASIMYVVIISQTDHAQRYDLNFRYFMPAAMMIIVLTVFYLATVIDALTRFLSSSIVSILYRPAMSYFLTFLLSAVVMFLIINKYGPIEPSCVFAAPDSRRIQIARLLVSNNYSAILGSYWDVWPVAFQVARLEYESNRPYTTFPTGFRSEIFSNRIYTTIRDRWIQAGSYRLLCIHPVKGAPVPGPTDCKEMVRWNQDWGSLPVGGLVHPEEPVANDVGSIDIVSTPIALGTTVPFAQTSAIERILLRGWSVPEQFGRWTDGQTAELLVRLDPLPPQDLMMTLDVVTSIGAFASPPQEIVVSVLVNDAPLDTWVFARRNQSTPRRVVIPRTLLEHSRGMVITLRIAKPHSPRELGFNKKDKRNLGIMVRSIRFDLKPS